MYKALLAVHVLSVLTWVGSGLGVQLLAARARRAGDITRLSGILADASWLGLRVFMPAGILALLSGIGMVIKGDWKFETTWIALGFVGWIASTIIGSAFLGPQSRKLASGGPDATATAGRVLTLMRIDLTILLLVVLDMVLKPGQ